MRVRVAIGLAVVVAVATAAGLGLADMVPAGIDWPATRAAPARQAPADSPCLVAAQNTAVPRILLLGETTQVTLRVRFVCPAEAAPLHIVLVLDASGSMEGEPNRQMQEAARKLIDLLDLRANPATMVGVVEFESSARTLCQLTNLANQARSCVNRVGTHGGTCVDCGIREGLRVLLAGRRQVMEREVLKQVMVVLSDGTNNDGCTPVLTAARQAKSQDILVVTVCLGDSCDAPCLRTAASARRYFFQARDAGDLARIFEAIREEVTATNLKQLVLTNRLPADMYLVAGSVVAVPEADENLGGEALAWTFDLVATDGVTVTFTLRPDEIGERATTLEAKGEFRDARDRPGRFAIPATLSYVTVLQPLPLPTDTPVSPEPSATTSGPTAPTPTAVIPTSTPPSAVPPRMWSVYVPRLERGWAPWVTP
jgi:Mg-chelatase subunit ChlD